MGNKAYRQRHSALGLCIDCDNQKGVNSSRCVRCLTRVRAAQKGKRKTTIRHKFSQLRQGAKRRGIETHLTFEQYQQVVASDACHYCGGSLPAKGHGVDRKDSSRAYSLDNSVPCCRTCQYGKGVMSDQEFREYLLRAGLFQSKPCDQIS